MKRYLPFIIIAIVATGAATSGTILYRAKRAELTRVLTTNPGAPADLGDQKSAHIRGDEDAKITLEEFGDFQCPPCGLVATSLGHIEHDYREKLRVIFREFPLPMHAHAREAARAAEAAGLQGRFWEMHDLLFRTQIAWSTAADVGEIFNEYARGLGLELDRFQKDCASEAVEARINADHQRGESLGVTSTPTIFINGHNIPPATYSEAGLRASIEAVIRGTPLPTPTPTPTPAK